ncbi:EI24 domain-containing protein [Sphingomonas sp. MMS12-HWE2-04]|uniref:EI24 domain-containing protein n=1 Tax=Sphingomonas sp. MMS12-HWE2-04 TaxID=3234199 RepID=UPI00385017BF
MIQAFILSLGQLTDRPILGVLVKSLLVTLLLFAALGVGMWFVLDWLAESAAHWLGTADRGGVFASIVTVALLILAWWLLFRAIAVAVVGVFADDVVAAVELRHYPAAHAQARAVPLARSVAMGLGSGMRAIGINLLLSPVYLMLLITGVGTALLFFLVNSWLLGRDLGDMVAARHMPATDLAAWRRITRPRRFTLGAAGTGMLLVPVLNLVAPVLGAAMATHMFHRGRSA